MVIMYKLLLQGIVHGVGLRYHILQLANRYKLIGTVRNVADGVEVIVNDKDFMKKLESISTMARITKHRIEKINVVGAKYDDFKVIMSEY